jgi:hypothetical protein
MPEAAEALGIGETTVKTISAASMTRPAPIAKPTSSSSSPAIRTRFWSDRTFAWQPTGILRSKDAKALVSAHCGSTFTPNWREARP